VYLHDDEGFRVATMRTTVAEVEPLLIAMTRQRAKCIETQKMARMYNREAWYYCEGPTMSIPKQDQSLGF
jgi:hypothetical protein